MQNGLYEKSCEIQLGKSQEMAVMVWCKMSLTSKNDTLAVFLLIIFFVKNIDTKLEQELFTHSFSLFPNLLHLKRMLYRVFQFSFFWTA